MVDVYPRADLKNYIQATGLALPFADESFDLVCSLDTLEHLPGEDRPAFLAELLRVTRDGLYVAFPFDSPSNRWAESMLVEYTSVLLNEPVPALLEHRQFGLPDRARIDGLFAGSSHPWIGFEQGNTDVWLLMMLTYHSLRISGVEFVQELNRRFNQVYAAQDWAAPGYRAGYVLSKRRSPADLQALRASFGSPEKRADLQAVLAFCQLFLNLAQNGRVTVDKDRHIRNIEQELVNAREKLRTHVEQAAAEQETLRAELDRTRLALTQKELENSELSGSISQIVTRLEKLPQQIAGVQGTVETLASQSARLDDRMRQLEISLVTNKRAIQAIYDSRIWKTLRGLGGPGAALGRPWVESPESRRPTGPCRIVVPAAGRGTG